MSKNIRLGAYMFGMIFLYLPIFILIIYSFNSSEVVSVWGGFSTKWYSELIRDQEILSAIYTSIKIASVSATLAVLLGVIAGYVVSRFKPARVRSFSAGLLSSSIVMPEVVLGFSFLLLFVTLSHVLGWPSQFGETTVILAHTIIGFSYVSFLVQSRLTQVDKSLEEAALDLGATPLATFVYITIPIIRPTIFSGWLLTFTISMDDLVVASFASGAGTTTLPMLIFSQIRFGINPKVNVLATLMVLVVFLVSFLVYWLRKNESKK
jgi:putrescine transport system permease protein